MVLYEEKVIEEGVGLAGTYNVNLISCLIVSCGCLCLFRTLVVELK